MEEPKKQLREYNSRDAFVPKERLDANGDGRFRTHDKVNYRRKSNGVIERLAKENRSKKARRRQRLADKAAKDK